MRTIVKSVLMTSAWIVVPLAVAADIDGTWLVSIDAPTGASKSTLVLAHDGDVITGRYNGQFGEAPVTGTTRGDDITLTYHVEMQGVPLDVTYTGTLVGDAMSGKVVVLGFGEGTFKATKQE